MSNVHRLAQLFKERDNKKTFGVNSGIVISSEPELVIQIDGKHDFKQDEIMVLFEPMTDYLRECEIELGFRTVSFQKVVKLCAGKS